MSISFEKFIDITSGVVAATAVGTRQFGLRIFTANPLVPVGGVLSASQLADVAILGTGSEEYARAAKYYDYTSPTSVKAKVLQFVRWVNVASPASIYGGANNAASLTALKLIVAGTLSFNIGGVVVPVNAINLSAATSLANAAALLQTALNTNANLVLATSTVTYDAVNGRFVFKGAAAQTQAQAFSLNASGAGVSDVATNLAWTTALGGLVSAPSPVVTPVNALIASVQANNNFGSFLFTDSGTGIVLAVADIAAVAAQNTAYNVKYRYVVNASPETYVDIQAAIGGLGGSDITYEADGLDDYPEMIPAIILAATDFTAKDGTQGYMYQQFSTINPSVTDDTLHDALIALNINFYGQTQVDGQDVSFYMDGVENGGSTDPRDMNVYANEMWLKDFTGVTIFNYILARVKVPANITGLAALRGLFTKTIVPAALNNGTFSPGKLLNDAQVDAILAISTAAAAVQNVQKYGWTLDMSLASTTVDGVTKWSVVYKLIYAKADLIRTVSGTHSLV